MSPFYPCCYRRCFEPLPRHLRKHIRLTHIFSYLGHFDHYKHTNGDCNSTMFCKNYDNDDDDDDHQHHQHYLPFTINNLVSLLATPNILSSRNNLHPDPQQFMTPFPNQRTNLLVQPTILYPRRAQHRPQRRLCEHRKRLRLLLRRTRREPNTGILHLQRWPPLYHRCRLR